MRVLCIGLTSDVMEMVTVALHLRWPETQIVETRETQRGLAIVEKENPDLLLLQSGDGSDVSLMDTIKELRRFSEAPLMVWGGDGGDVEAVKALDLGADDYIRPPCGLIELVARMVALLRRLRGEVNMTAAPAITSGELGINPTTYEAFRGEERLELTPTEFRLLYVLVKNRSSVVPHRFLERLLWENRSDCGALLKKYVQRLRRKLGDDPNQPQWIANIRGVGYRYIGPTREATREVAPLTSVNRGLQNP